MSIAKNTGRSIEEVRELVRTRCNRSFSDWLKCINLPEHKPLEGGGVLIKEIAVAGTRHQGAVPESYDRQSDKKGGQGRVTADDVVAVFPNEGPQLPGCCQISGGGHALFQWNGISLMDLVQFQRGAGTGHVHLPTPDGKGVKVGAVKVPNMRKCGCHKQNTAHSHFSLGFSGG